VWQLRFNVVMHCSISALRVLKHVRWVQRSHVALLLLLLLPVAQLAARPLLVISVDGLDYRYLRDADRLGLKIPHMRRMAAEGTAEFQEWQAKMSIINGKAEVIIGKQRHGPIGTVGMQFDGAVTRFSDLAHDQYLPERRE